MSRLTQDGTTEPVSLDQIVRRERGQGNVHFPCSADHEQDWQPYLVDTYSAQCDDYTYIYVYIFSLSVEMSRLTRDETAEPVSRDQILMRERGEGNVHFPCSADHERDWQPYPVDHFLTICDDHTYIHTCIHTYIYIENSRFPPAQIRAYLEKRERSK